jgi:hypothetical protein
MVVPLDASSDKARRTAGSGSEYLPHCELPERSGMEKPSRTRLEKQPEGPALPAQASPRRRVVVVIMRVSAR